MDMSETIAKLTMEYVKPEYPIYKMKVFYYSQGVECDMHTKTIILEHNDKGLIDGFIQPEKKYLDLNYRIDFDRAIIHTDFLNELEEDENLTWFDGFESIQYGVIYCKRIA